MKIDFITSYFNPGKFVTPLSNFKKFAENFDCNGGVSMVELCFGNNAPEINSSWKGIKSHTTLKCNSIMWQKERILNHWIENNKLADAI